MCKGVIKFTRIVLLFWFFIASLSPAFVFANWTTYGSNLERNATIPSAIKPDLEKRWSKTTTDNKTYEMPVYQNGIFYFCETGAGFWSVYAVRKDTGNEIWRKNGIGTISSQLMVDGDNIFVATTKLFNLRASNGSLKWEVTVNSYFYYLHPMSYEGVVYVWSKYGNTAYIYAYDLVTGNKVWTTPVAKTASGVKPFSVYNNTLIALCSNNNYSFVSRIGLDGTGSWNVSMYRNPSGPVVVSGDNGFLSTISGGIYLIDLSHGIIKKSLSGYANASVPVVSNGHAYFLATTQYDSGAGDTFIFDWGFETTDGPFRRETYDYFRSTSSANLILLGEELYFSGGKNLTIFDLISHQTKVVEIEEGLVMGEIMLADDIFVVMDTTKKNIFFATDVHYAINTDMTIRISSPYNCDDCQQYLGQLHSHFKPDLPGVESTPAEVETKYRDAGYDFIALTEHNEIVHDPGVDGITHIVDSEENTQGRSGNHILGIGVSESVSIDLQNQGRVNGYSVQGGEVILAHPNSFFYPWNITSLISSTNYHSLEIYNNAIDVNFYVNPIPDISEWHIYDRILSTDKWDELLTRGKKVWGSADDDYTPGNPGFDGGAVVVNAKSNTQAEIIKSLKEGNYYSIQGSNAPRMSVRVEGNQIVATSPSTVGEIRFIGKNGEILYAPRGVNQAIYNVVGSEKYVRVEMHEEDLRSWSEPIFIDQVQTLHTSWIGKNEINMDSAKLIVNANDSLLVSSLNIDQYPSALPPLGLYSPIYNFQSGNIESAHLEIDYSTVNLPFTENSLSLYTYNEDLSAWEKVPSVVNDIDKKVSADLTHFSYYALSADITDNTAPSLSLLNPETLTNNTINLEINAIDESKIIHVSGYIDQLSMLFEDRDGSDGYNQAIDLTGLESGNHILNITAEDYFGNSTETSYEFEVQSINSKKAHYKKGNVITKQEGQDINNIEKYGDCKETSLIERILSNIVIAKYLFDCN